MVGMEVTRTISVFRCDMPFADWWVHVCEVMGLDSENAELGYKFESQWVGDNPIQITSAADLDIMMGSGQAMAQRAVSKVT